MARTRARGRRLRRPWRIIALGLFAAAVGCYDYQSAVPLWPEGTPARDPALAGQWDMYVEDEAAWFSQLPGTESDLPVFLFLLLDDSTYYVVFRISPGTDTDGGTAEALHFRGTCGAVGGVPLLQLRTLAFEEGRAIFMPESETEQEYRFLRYAFTPEGELSFTEMSTRVFDREETGPANPEALRAFIAAHICDPDLFEEESTVRLRPCRLPKTRRTLPSRPQARPSRPQ